MLCKICGGGLLDLLLDLWSYLRPRDLSDLEELFFSGA